ncbi:MAG: DedA family protein [Ignavibacteria bacterium]|nr:DedA family protein [Ignavibacteria bacterium]
MDFILYLFDFILHVDVHLGELIRDYGALTYGILFLIIFCETGLVVTPFLPGDSLLFAAGAFGAKGDLDPHLVFLILAVAAFLGDSVNYYIGKKIGHRAYTMNSRFIKKEHLQKTHQFFEKHGGKTIIFARFFPIIRTFAPFVAGIGEMEYKKFISYNAVGGVLWVAIFVYLGYFFGNLPFVKQNFTIVLAAIVVISLAPAIIGVIKKYTKPKAEPEA